MSRNRPMSILPPGMDGRPYNGPHGKDGALQDWQKNATDTLARSLDRPNDSNTTHRVRPAGQQTIRPVTPERHDWEEKAYASIGPVQTSPRSILGGEKRRQGLVFQDSYSTDSLEGGGGGLLSGPPVSFHLRPRNKTINEPPHQRSGSTTVSKSRHRIGSVHSTNAASFHDIQPQTNVSNPLGFAPNPTRPSQLPKPDPVKGGRRLTKKSSRPKSTLSVMGDGPPSVDSLPLPVTTEDANKILILMKTSCGRMRGEVEYQAVENGPLYTGICYIDDVKGSLMYEGDDRGPFHLTVVSDLRGCRVEPRLWPDKPLRCLELSNKAAGLEIYLMPKVKAEFDLWLAALLCWQQIRMTTLPANPTRSSAGPPLAEKTPAIPRRDSTTSGNGPRSGNIIKVAKLLLWDRGAPSSPSAIVRRPSTRDLRSSSRSGWRKVSCILQDNGELKLLTENDIILLSVIQLSQLSRCAIQRLDRSVLDEEYCLAIFPQYTPGSTELSILRPLYIALESRLTHEVWFCLLRAFTIPEIYGPQIINAEDDDDLYLDPPLPSTNDMFRMEKSISLRVIEAKIRRLPPKTEHASLGKSIKGVDDPSFGDYFVEVILDGEVRARTKTRNDTRNPFWREDCEFLDLPAHLPSLSVVLKQLEQPMSPSHGFLSSSSVHVTGPAIDITCGTVEIQVDKLDRGKDNEAWWPIMDDQQDPIGEIFLRIRHDELVVLLAKDYQPIYELLHNFCSGLTVQIAQVVPTSLRKLAETLMNIFQVSGHSLEWLSALVEDEIDGLGREQPNRRFRWSRRIGSNESYGGSVSDREHHVRDMGRSLQGEANLLFRGNSLLTQALDFHMRRVGKEYMEDVLSAKIMEINARNPDCEVDPSRISNVDDLEKNWKLLTTLTTEVWESIAGSVQRCPPEIRQVLKFVRACTEDRYGDYLRTVSYTSVSGFLFLRFFCPALLNPKLFGLLRDHPQPKAQRTLTLIAKSLQALANLSHFGQKESWMEPMNSFLARHRQGVKDFLDAICDIPAEANNHALPASYSTPITILARLPQTSREGFPSLPYLIDHARNFATLVNLWLDAVVQNAPPQGFEGDLLEFHELCLDLQRRTDYCLLKAEQADRSADQMSLQWEDIIDTLHNASLDSPASGHELDSVMKSGSASRTATSTSSQNHSPKWTEYPAAITSGQSTTHKQNHSSSSNHIHTPNERHSHVQSLTPVQPRLPPGSAGSEEGGLEKRDKQYFWDSKFGNAHQHQIEQRTLTISAHEQGKHEKSHDLIDGDQVSPPSSGQSRSGSSGGGNRKSSRSFLGGLRRKGRGDSTAAVNSEQSTPNDPPTTNRNDTAQLVGSMESTASMGPSLKELKNSGFI
ncbi:related to BUD2-GTPase-activating protein for Bud1p/Rsr1p [Rhynchosporium graminicola]|uniref:Related to BUD2-GTPase-activating protein for Bud1p/Rsr1p n=1 Tax=Rhynchosporium graminicola TaxID=2792576 RepID=A0A1E1JQ93_9HELO|nr:related to BUD2-GTPase-activating protein for Bud1p/Rsr1p [Rhynchosporium commune]